MVAPGSLENLFEGWWRKVRQRLGDRDHPVMIRSGDELHWLYDGERNSQPVVDAQYHRVKRIAHVPVLLATIALGPAAARDAGQSAALTQTLRQVEGDVRLGDQCVAAETIASLRDACEGFAAHLEPGEEPGAGALRDLAERSFPALNRLIAAAAHYEVGRLHEAVTRIARESPASALDRAYFVVCAGLQPRYKELSKSYFEAFVNRRVHTRGGAEHRVIFVEGDDDLDTVLDHVARRECNRVLAEFMTGSPAGLDQDILGVAAQQAIGRLFDSHS